MALAGDTIAMRLRVVPAFAGVTIACDGDQALQPRSGNQDQPHDVISCPSRKASDWNDPDIQRLSSRTSPLFLLMLWSCRLCSGGFR